MLTDAEKAKRYRRKLIDLIELVEKLRRSETVANQNNLFQEAAIVREQLEIEDRFEQGQYGENTNRVDSNL